MSNQPNDIGQRVASLEARVSNMEKIQQTQHKENQDLMERIWGAIETNRNNHDDKYMKLFRLVYMGLGGIAALELILKLPELLKPIH